MDIISYVKAKNKVVDKGSVMVFDEGLYIYHGEATLVYKNANTMSADIIFADILGGIVNIGIPHIFAQIQIFTAGVGTPDFSPPYVVQASSNYTTVHMRKPATTTSAYKVGDTAPVNVMILGRWK